MNPLTVWNTGLTESRTYRRSAVTAGVTLRPTLLGSEPTVGLNPIAWAPARSGEPSIPIRPTATTTAPPIRMAESPRPRSGRLAGSVFVPRGPTLDLVQYSQVDGAASMIDSAIGNRDPGGRGARSTLHLPADRQTQNSQAESRGFALAIRRKVSLSSMRVSSLMRLADQGLTRPASSPRRVPPRLRIIAAPPSAAIPSLFRLSRPGTSPDVLSDPTSSSPALSLSP